MTTQSNSTSTGLGCGPCQWTAPVDYFKPGCTWRMQCPQCQSDLTRLQLIETADSTPSPIDDKKNPTYSQPDVSDHLESKENVFDDASAFGGYAQGVSGSASNYEENVVMGASRGHGFAAEKANHLRDVLTGKDAKLVGGDNAKDGADRIVNGQHIQTKYCRTGAKCVEEVFRDNKFRYWNPDGSPMQIEVPSDMHESAIQAMRERIRKGQVLGVSDPEVAKEIIRKGHYTYEQARNIARFGTVESLTYDAVNGIKLAGTAMGLTSTLAFAGSMWRGEPFGQALDEACFEGISVGGILWISSVLAAQAGRTSMESGMRVGTDWVVKKMGSNATQFLANAFRESGKEIYGAAAARHASKLLRGNVVSVLAVTGVMSVNDFGMLFEREISGTQFMKNLGKRASAVAGGAAGAWAGAAAGTAIFPGVGTAVGIAVGGVAGGAGTSYAVGKGLDAAIDDDSVGIQALLQRTFAESAEEYLLTAEEATKAIALFEELHIESVLQSIQASANKYEFSKRLWAPFMAEQLLWRMPITLPTEAAIEKAIGHLVDQFSEAAQAAEKQTEDKSSLHKPEFAKKEKKRVTRAARTLGEMILLYEHVLNDGNVVYCGKALESGKGLKKLLATQDGFARRASLDALLIVDSTVWGSAAEGFYFTETDIHCKGLYEEERFFRIEDIRDIKVRNEELVVNGKSVKWLSEVLTSKMKILVRLIEQHLVQIKADGNTSPLVKNARGDSKADTAQSRDGVEADLIEVRVQLASTTSIPESLQTELLLENNISVHIALARNASLDTELQAKLASKNLDEINEALADNECLSSELQQRFYETGREKIKHQLAKNPGLNPELQLCLAADEDPAIRASLACNPALTAECQAALMMYPDDDYWQFTELHPVMVLIRNPSLTTEIMQLMAKSRNKDILQNLAANTSLAVNFMEKIMNQLTASTEAEEAEMIFPVHFKFSEAFKEAFVESSGNDHKIRVNLAQNKSLPEPLQQELMKGDESGYDFSGHNTTEIHMALASNTSICEDVQAQLSQKRSANPFGFSLSGNTRYSREPILQALAGNTALTSAHQALLAEHENEDARIALAGNPALDEAIRVKVISSFSDDDLAAAERLADDARSICSERLDELSLANEKHLSATFASITSFFNMDKKIEKLDQEREYARKKWIEADAESDKNRIKVQKIKAMLLLQPPQ